MLGRIKQVFFIVYFVTECKETCVGTLFDNVSNLFPANLPNKPTDFFFENSISNKYSK